MSWFRSASASALLLLVIASAGCGDSDHGGGFVGGQIPDAARSTATANPTQANADGMSAITFTITIRDSGGNTIPNAAVQATASGTNNAFTGGGLTNSVGVATLSHTTTQPGLRTVTFTAFTLAAPSGIQLAQTLQVTFNPVPTAQSGSTIAAVPTTVVANGSATSAVTVTVRDSLGNVVQGASVAFSAPGATNVTFTPSTPVTTGNGGTATVNVSSTTAQAATISAAISFVGSSATAAATVTTPVNFIAGQPVALAFAGSPSTPAADPFTLVVTIVDANGNVCPDNREVALCLPNEPNSPNTPCSKLTESPAGVVPRAFVHQNRFGFTNANVNTIVVARNGVALFPGLSNSSSGTYRVGAIAKGLTPGVGTYTIVGNTATQVRWKVLLNGSGRAATTTNNPAPLVTGGTFGYNLIVYACDVFGNITSRFRDNGSHPIQLSGNGLTLTGAGTVGNATPSINLDANGMAVFPNIGTSSPAAATLVTITATDLANGAGGTSAFTLFSAMSNQFEVVATNAPCAIQLTNVPASLTAGTASPSITASIFDSAGNVATAPVGGVPFTFVLLNDEGFLIQQGFTIPAGMSSTTFAVTLLGFNAQGGNGTPLTFNSTFNDGTNTVRLREQVLATQVQLIPGPATSIALTQTPLRGYANGSLPPRLGVGQNVAPSVEVTARDAFGNVATGFTGTAALTITPTTTGTGTFNGGGSTSLAGTAVNGRATFAFNVNGAVAASVPDTYTLNANTGTIANVSNPFNLIVVAPTDVTQTLNPARLVFLNAPQSNTAGSSVLPTDNTNEIRVQVQDAFGTPILVAGTTITVDGLGSSGTTYAPNGTSIGNGGTNIGSSWGPTTAMTDAQGIARFPNLNNPVTGANVVLVATANNVNNAVCVPFDIVPGAPNSESFLKDVQGTLSRSGEIIGPVGPGGTGRPVLRITDSAGNVVTDFTGSFTASIELPAPTNAGILSGTLNVPCVSGIAVFNDLTITNQGGGSGAIVSPYQLRFKSTGITNSNGLTSTPFGVQNP